MTGETLERRPSPAPRDLQRGAIVGALTSLGSTVVLIPVAIVSVVLVARILSPAAFGSYARLAFILPILLASADLGVTGGMGWRVSRFSVTDRDLMASTLSTAFTAGFLKAVLMGFLSVFFSRSDHGAALVLGVSVATLCLLGPVSLALNGDRLFVWQAVSASVAAVTGAAGLIAGAWFGRNYEWATAGYYAGRSLGLLTQISGIAPDMRSACFRFGSLRFERSFVRFMLANWLSGLTGSYASGRSEILFLRGLATGQFAAATTTSARATILTDALSGAIDTTLLALDSTEPDLMDPAYRRVSRVTTCLAMLTGTCVLPAAALLTRVAFGRSYPHLLIPTLALCCGSVLQTATGYLGVWAAVMKRSRALLGGASVAALVDLVLSFLLIPPLGLTGAVISNIGATLALPLFFVTCGGMTKGQVKEAIRGMAYTVLALAWAVVAVLLVNGLNALLATACATLLATAGLVGSLFVLAPLGTAADGRALALPRLARLNAPIQRALLPFFRDSRSA